MKVTFPHLGSTHIVVKILFDALGTPYVIPPENGKESLRLGSLISPEEICIPFKLRMRNYIQSIQKGSDTVLIVGSCGPKEKIAAESIKTSFKGFSIASKQFVAQSFECSECPNGCEVVKIVEGKEIIACFANRCGSWSSKIIG